MFTSSIGLDFYLYCSGSEGWVGVDVFDAVYGCWLSVWVVDVAVVYCFDGFSVFFGEFSEFG